MHDGFIHFFLASSVIERLVGFGGVIRDRSMITVKSDPEVRIFADLVHEDFSITAMMVSKAFKLRH